MDKKVRKIANVTKPITNIVRVMIFDNGMEVYLFLYDQYDDGASCADYWFESVAEAESACSDDFGISAQDWRTISDPQPDCQHDWIQPTRIKVDANGNKISGQFEAL